MVNWVRQRRGVIGYMILAAAVALAFFTTWLNDRDIERARIERLEQLNTINVAQCQSLTNLYAVIRKSLHDADKAIDELSYYRLYPRERARAHARNQRTIELFKTPPCPRHFTVQPN